MLYQLGTTKLNLKIGIDDNESDSFHCHPNVQLQTFISLHSNIIICFNPVHLAINSSEYGIMTLFEHCIFSPFDITHVHSLLFVYVINLFLHTTRNPYTEIV